MFITIITVLSSLVEVYTITAAYPHNKLTTTNTLMSTLATNVQICYGLVKLLSSNYSLIIWGLDSHLDFILTVNPAGLLYLE